jgi:DNA repair ATPase RecN
MEENGINEDQIEPIIQDIAAYCLRHNESYDTVIKNGREALYLEEKFSLPVEKIPELIIQAKERIDKLEGQTQEILRQREQAQEMLDTIVAELQKYGGEIPLIERVKQLEAELDEAKRSERSYKIYHKRLVRDVAMLDNQNKEYLQGLSQSYKEIEKLKEANEKLVSENKDLKIENSSLKTVDE